ncbi:MAG TPA: type II toxin-antitoxin system PemK/MazF family toxin [Gemmataceae bacterium]|nr:type II toxin-antitoxin system PemK/MazF family toxin [Gemmataceae bacterium]
MKRGDVVMVDWPYNDRQGSKFRPAVVVQGDYLNGLIHDTILVAVTRSSRGAATTEVVIDPTAEPRSGLRYRSIISCNNFLTLDQALVVRTVGSLSTAAMQQVDDGLKSALDLP